MSTTLHHAEGQRRHWLLVDAKDRVLGRMASRIAILLRGKHKVAYTPYIDTGDFVVVVNASQIRVTGRKLTQKAYHRYSGYPGGQRTRILGEVMKTRPEWVIRRAVKGMLPHGPLGRQMLTKLKVYAGSEHPHAAQQPAPAGERLIGAGHGDR